MVRVRFGGCRVLRDRLIASVSLARRDEDARWLSIDEVAPGWFAHRLAIRAPDELDDPRLAELVCESYRDFGLQGRLHGSVRRRIPSERP